MVTKYKQYNLRIEESLLDDLSKTAGTNVSEFIRNAIVEKLNRKKISQDEMYQRFKKIDNLDTESVRKTVASVDFTVQVIYQEIKKHNDAFKLLLRRSALGSAFSAEVLNKADEQKRALIEDTVVIKIDEEIKKLKI